LGSRRNDDYGERDENENGVVNGTLKPGEGFLPDYEDEGDAIVKSEFLSGDDRERSKSANSYKGKLEETNGSNGNGAINGSASNGKYFQGRSSLGDDLGVDDDDSDQEPDDEEVLSDMERDSKGNFLDERRTTIAGGDNSSSSSKEVAAPLTDKYGFIIDPKNQTGSSGGARTTQVTISEKEKARRAEVEALRTTKWLAMIKDWDNIKDTKRTRNRIRKGVPDKVRGLVWNLLGNVPTLIKENPGRYTELCESTHIPSQDIRDTILRDINRTFPRHAMFANEGEGQDSLRRVLVAYSLYDEEVGYCQGLGFITAMFLTYMPEEEAFWQLVGIMNHGPCCMRGLYEDGMPEAQKVLYIGEKLIKKFFPRLTKHLGRQNCHISMYATQWFLTIFTNTFPFDMVTQVWDCFLAEGWKIVYRVMLTFIRYSAPKLFRLEFEQIMFFFKQLPGAIDGPLLMEKAFGIPLKTRHVEHYSKKFDTLNPDIANRVQIKEQKKKEQEERIKKEIEEAEARGEGGVLTTTLSIPSAEL